MEEEGETRDEDDMKEMPVATRGGGRGETERRDAE